MLFTPDDDFTDHTQTWDLPDCAVALLTRAGSWSARNSQDGFVPSAMLARFSSDPVQAVSELTRRKVWRRVKGGYQFSEWERWGETTEQVERRRAAAAERQRKSRARKKEKPQVVRGGVTPLSHVTSRDGHTDPDRSDLDFDQSVAVGQSKSKSDAREAGLVVAVSESICAKVGHVPTEDQALAVIAKVRERAKKAGKRIRNPLTYIPASVANEPDLYAGLLEDEPPPLSEILAEARGDHLPPGYDPAELHEFDLNQSTGACRCDRPRANWRHGEPPAKARTA